MSHFLKRQLGIESPQSTDMKKLIGVKEVVDDYFEERRKKTRERLEKIKNEQLAKEQGELQDRPKISKNSKKIVERIMREIQENQREAELAEKKLEQEREKEANNSEMVVSFNSRTTKKTKTAKKEPSCSAISRSRHFLAEHSALNCQCEMEFPQAEYNLDKVIDARLRMTDYLYKKAGKKIPAKQFRMVTDSDKNENVSTQSKFVDEPERNLARYIGDKEARELYTLQNQVLGKNQQTIKTIDSEEQMDERLRLDTNSKRFLQERLEEIKRSFK